MTDASDACDTRHPAFPLFLKAYASLVQRLEDELHSETGLSLTWFDVLAQLATAPQGQLPMHVLADEILLSKSGLTRLVDRMILAGLVTRAACPTDRRVVYATITERGRTTFDETLPIATRGVSENFAAHLTKNEERALMSICRKILTATAARPGVERAAG